MQRKYFQLNLDCWTECFLARVGRCEERKERLVVRERDQAPECLISKASPEAGDQCLRTLGLGSQGAQWAVLQREPIRNHLR